MNGWYNWLGRNVTNTIKANSNALLRSIYVVVGC